LKIEEWTTLHEQKWSRWNANLIHVSSAFDGISNVESPVLYLPVLLTDPPVRSWLAFCRSLQ
jgi:hypothetical protein